MEKKVMILRGDHLYQRLMKSLCFDMADTLSDASLVLFTGGEDVNPALYGHEVHDTTHYNAERDIVESYYFEECVQRRIPMVGICRGAQFLNVMNGGEMYQNITGHIGSHMLHRNDDHPIEVTSTHHQMMKPTDKATILGYAHEYGVRTYWDDESKRFVTETSDLDYEVVYYNLNDGKAKSLCFQPHPEFKIGSEMADYFGSLVKQMMEGTL